MFSQKPLITGLTDSGMRHRFTGRAGIDAGAGLVIGLVNDIELAEGKPGQFDVEVDVHQSLQFDRENVSVPACQFSRSVIANDVGALLGCR